VSTDVSPSRRLIVGSGGSGRTYLLRSWAAEYEVADQGPVVWITGHHARPVRATAITNALKDDPALLILDDMQWFDEEALDVVLEALESPSFADLAVWGSRRTWPLPDALQAVSDILTETRTVTRTGLLANEEFAQIVSSFSTGAASTKALDELHQATAGSLGLASDAVNGAWEQGQANISSQLVEAVANRLTRCGPEAAATVRLLAVAPSLAADELLEALESGIDPDDAYRATRAGGMLDEAGLLLPLVRAAVLADISAAARSDIHDRLAVALVQSHPDHAADSVMAGRGGVQGSEQVLIDVSRGFQRSDPARAIDMADHGLASGFDHAQLAAIKARAAYEQGSRDAFGYLEDVTDGGRTNAAAIGFGLDMRDLRWRAAAEREVSGEVSQPLFQLAGLLSGDVAEIRDEGSHTGGDVRLVSSIAQNLTLLAAGNSQVALSGLAEAADDFDRVGCDVPIGITPHALGASAALSIGDLAMAEALLEQAQSRQSGGEGEDITHRLLHAYSRLVGGSFEEALKAVRDGENMSWSLRDRFLLAAIDAAIARRSGDTSRLRESWKRAEPVLVRTAASWIFADLAVDLLAAGSRLGETRRVQPIADELVAQLEGLPRSGAGRVSALWLRLQLALAGDDRAARSSVCEEFGGCVGVDDRSSARIRAAEAWAAIQNQAVDDNSLRQAAQGLEFVGDRWEASRLLGQAALDHPDPATARRLLEEARTLAVEPRAAGESGLLALGLSDREAEVAVLVAAGRTYKEVGAQLYVSPKTVEHHVAHIRRKIGASSRAEFLSKIRAATDIDS
jgi:DNA-binding CsgD family transcriptional regulator